MKTRLLIIIGISVVTAISLSYYAIYDSSTTVFISCDPRYEQIDGQCVLLKSEIPSVMVEEALEVSMQEQNSDVKIEWLGWSFFRITTPSGVVILTNPWYENPDNPTSLDDIPEADIILVPTLEVRIVRQLFSFLVIHDMNKLTDNAYF